MSIGSESATRISAGQALTAEDIATAGLRASDEVARYALRLGDDSLILAQRLSWWISRAPELEEDMALGNIALDLLGHARSFLTYAGTAWDRTEDDLAYFRDEHEFTAVHLVQLENGDFGQTIAKQIIFSLYLYELYSRLVDSTDTTIAGIAAKALKEVEYHVDHAWQWMLRLGLGTDESHRRMQRDLDTVWPYVDELFEDDDLVRSLEGVAVLPSSLREGFDASMDRVLEESSLTRPTVAQAVTGGRRGEHREAMAYLLTEMQSLARRHPGATW